MFGKRGLFGKKGTGPSREGNTFEPEGSTKRVLNPVPPLRRSAVRRHYSLD